MEDEPIALTVVGGYLGAGKTTLVNRLLADPGGRRLGVIVNDFGELAIDAELLAGAAPGDVVSLPNGCVCCTLGADLQQTLAAMTAGDDRPDQILVEVSGVADPAATSAWGTVPPFAPGGVIVLAAADTVRRQADDRYVGAEVRRQLAGADLVVVTKTDLVDPGEVADVRAWCATVSGAAPDVVAERGRLAADIVLGLRPPAAAPPDDAPGHGDRYARWSWRPTGPVSGEELHRLLDAVPAGVLRMKGWLPTQEGAAVVVDVVGRRRELREITTGPPSGPPALVAIGVVGQLDPAALDGLLGAIIDADRD